MVSAQRWLAHEVAKVDSDPIEARTFISTTYNSARMSLTTSSDEIAISPPERVSKTIGSFNGQSLMPLDGSSLSDLSGLGEAASEVEAAEPEGAEAAVASVEAVSAADISSAADADAVRVERAVDQPLDVGGLVRQFSDRLGDADVAGRA